MGINNSKSGFPTHLISKILYYLLYNSNILNSYQLYYKTLSLVSKYWLKVIDDIQTNNIEGIRYAGSRKPIRSLKEFKELSKLMNKKALNLYLEEIYMDIYLQDSSLDNYITMIYMNDQIYRSNLNIRPSPTLKALNFCIPVSEYQKDRLNILSDDIFKNLDELTLRFYTFRKINGLDIDIKVPLENNGKNTMKSLCNLKSLVIYGLVYKYSNEPSEHRITLLNLGETISENNMNNLKVFKFSYGELSSDSLVSILTSCKVLKELKLLSIYFHDRWIGQANINHLFEDVIGNSKSLKTVDIDASFELSLNSFINCLSNNKSITQLKVNVRGGMIKDLFDGNTITNTTLKNISLCEDLSVIPIIKYWGSPSNLNSFKIYSDELTSELSSLISQYHSSSTEISYRIYKVPKDSRNINLFDIKLPNLKYLVLYGEIKKQDIFTYISLNCNTITSLCISSRIKFKSMCTIIRSLKSITSLEFLIVESFGCKLSQLVDALLVNQSLLSIRVASVEGTPVEYVKSLISILNNNPNLQDIEILVKNIVVSFQFSQKSLKILKKTLIQRSLNIRSISTNFLEISQILREFLILNNKS